MRYGNNRIGVGQERADAGDSAATGMSDSASNTARLAQNSTNLERFNIRFLFILAR